MVNMTLIGEPNPDFEELSILDGDTIVWVSLHAGTLVTSTWEPGNYTSGFIARELGSCVE